MLKTDVLKYRFMQKVRHISQILHYGSSLYRYLEIGKNFHHRKCIIVVQNDDLGKKKINFLALGVWGGMIFDGPPLKVTHTYTHITTSHGSFLVENNVLNMKIGEFLRIFKNYKFSVQLVIPLRWRTTSLNVFSTRCVIVMIVRQTLSHVYCLHRLVIHWSVTKA